MGALSDAAGEEALTDHSPLLSSSSSISCLTVWRKSLLFHGHGYAVYDDLDGRLVFRVDNYSYNWRDETFLMDGRGSVLITIKRRRKKWGIWEAYKGDMELSAQAKPLLIARKALGNPNCSVLVATGDGPLSFRMNWRDDKDWLKIYNSTSSLSPVAEVNRKCGPNRSYSKDVLTLRVQPGTDLTTIMAMVMINDAMR